MKDYYNIENWTGKLDKFQAYIGLSKEEKKRSRPKVDKPDFRLRDIDPIWLYCLLKTKISNKPNGFYTLVQQREPIANIFWWDFILESDIGFILVWRRHSHLEYLYKIDDEKFDVVKFFKKSIGANKSVVLKTLSELETHTLYINHYDSYKQCAEYLFGEINKVDISKPDLQNAVKNNTLEVELNRFIKNSVKFHALGKSHILNCAFMIESFLNLYIRVTIKSELKDFPDIQKKFLNSTFNDKLKNLKFYSVLLDKPIETGNQIIQSTLNLIRLRNKYVHFDESADINKLGEVKFDGLFPVFPEYKDSPLIFNIERNYHNPSKEDIKEANKVSKDFVNYIYSLTNPKHLDRLLLIMNQNPIGYNESKKMYSAIFENLYVDFFPVFNDDDTLDINSVMVEKPNKNNASG